MKTIWLCLFLSIALAEEQYYDSRYDNFDVQELLGNIRLLKAYGNCFLNKGPCTQEGNDFKSVVPEAIKTNCEKCSPKQRELIRTVIRGFMNKLPNQWDEILDQQDPENKYRESLDKFLNESS